MARAVSVQFTRDVFAQETGEVYAHLLAITHALLPVPIRITDNSETVTVAATGDPYIPFPFTISMPDDEEGRLPEVRLTIDNIGMDQRLIQELRSIEEAALVSLKIARITDPGAGVVEAEPLPFVWRDVEYNDLELSGVLRMDENFLDQAWPRRIFSKENGFAAFTA